MSVLMGLSGLLAEGESAAPDINLMGAFWLLFGLALAVLLLVRSMVKHLRKVQYSPDPAKQPLDDVRDGAAGRETH